MSLPRESIPSVADLPYLTDDLPGIGGVLKSSPADFVVEEIPAYLPSGEGEHLYLWIEKEDVSADALVRHLSQTLGVGRDDVGVAGLKDRRAITRQFVSVPAAAEGRLGAVKTDAIRLLSASRHTNKLKTGHLRGNRFSILLRAGEEAGRRAADWAAAQLPLAQQIVDRLRDVGVPNYFGEQRFGIGAETSDLGFALLRGEKTTRDIPPAKRKFLLRLALSAAQSVLFNQALADRMRRQQLRIALVGDVMRKCVTGGLFTVTDAPVDQARLDAGELQVTGPLFGPKMTAPRGEPAVREAAILAAAQLTPEAFRKYPKLTMGARRPYLVHLEDAGVAPKENGLQFAFTLPSGTYATIVLREFMKSE